LNASHTASDQLTAQTTVRRQAVTPRTAYSVRTASNAVISPDGKQIAYLVSEWLPDQERACNRLWLADSAGVEARPLTKGPRRDNAASWSPDGRYLAFASKIEHENGSSRFQLHSMDLTTGEERQIGSVPNAVSNVTWSPDGKHIAFCTLEGKEPQQDPHVQNTAGERHLRLWTIRPDDDSPEPITPDGFTIWHYAWSPDSRKFALYYATGSEETDWYTGQIGLVAASGGAIHQISQLKRQAFALTWSPDGTRLGYVSGEWSDPDRGGGDIFVHSLAHGQTHNVTPGIDWSPVWLKWYPDGQRILCAGWAGLTTRIAVLNEATGAITTITDDFLIGDRHWPHLSTTADMQHLAATHSELHPYDIWSGELNIRKGRTPSLTWQRVTQLNPIAEETLELTGPEHISYQSVDGWSIQALVTWPKQQPANALPPLIVHIHGGPSACWQDDWDGYFSQNLVAAGFAVLRPNIRGSMGSGVAFADAVVSDMGGKDFQDILAGVDYLVDRKLVDSMRIGIMGWSYGGFMTSWAVTQTRRFKAAVMGAGICDFHSFHAQTNIQDWDMRFLGTINNPINPLTHPGDYREHSSITYAGRVTTPTLIVHGERDACVPINQAYAFYRSLREQNIPTELVSYPREGHGPQERAHILDYMQRTLAWFQRYL
jgi:dipeptidyl aminopeptidase/acylaminoacyl peptidase